MTQAKAFEHSKPVLVQLTILAALACAAPVSAQPQNCPLQGDSKQPLARELNPYKNRDDAPLIEQVNRDATLSAWLAPGDDLRRWSREEGAIIEGIVINVKAGGIESVNCHSRELANRDTHIEVAIDSTATSRRRVIVEVTPRWRSKMAVIADWSTSALRRTLIGRHVWFIGWLFDDLEHKQQAENTNQGGDRNWRATVWEIHPVTGIQVLPVRKVNSTPNLHTRVSAN